MSENDRDIRLVEAYRETGDRRAMERLLKLHGRILNKLVRRYAVSSAESHEDLRQVGYVGLLKAVRGYRPVTNAKFSSYAYSMIDGELRHHFRDTGLVKRPRWARSLYSKVSEATVKLTAELGRPPLVEEVAREVNVTTEGVLELMKLYHDTNVVPAGERREDESGADVSAIRSIRYESFSLPIEDRIHLEQALESLTELQRKVVYLFFYKDISQTDIGQMLDLPQRKISRIIAAATKRMHKAMS